jgi:bifunctional DNA-binding transcriptional regulator/antitoxin component of YhaV-PrlF toxin-antitoxin module
MVEAPASADVPSIECLVIALFIMQTKISTRWQTVVPRGVREELGIGPDWTLSWEVREGVMVVVPIPPDPVRASLGMFKGSGMSVEDLLEERRRERERERELERREDERWERRERKKGSG